MDIRYTKKITTIVFSSMGLFLMIILCVLAMPAWSSDQTNGNASEMSGATGTAILDGLTFVGALGPEGKPADVEDTFVFEDGKFVSKECEERCKFPASPYFTRHVGETIEFVSRTECPYKKAELVWKGTVVGDTIKGVINWTSERWYWTIKKDLWFEGKLVKETTASANRKQ